MTRVLSLRGTWSMTDNEPAVVDKEVFIYEAGELSKGWEIERAYLWPKTTRASIGTSDGQFQVCASLATDKSYSLDFETISNAADSRQIAWCNSGYQLRAAGTDEDFLANSGNNPNPAEFVIDPQSIVKKGLWLNAFATSDSATEPTRDWNYMIILRPKKLSSQEAILHLIKNVAQDVSN